MRSLVLLAALMPIAACVTQARLDGPPADLGGATPIGFDAPVRAYAVDRRFFETQSAAYAATLAASVEDGSLDVLALSGGGSGGAYGAGVLVGLSEAGARPRYEIVTGVSTGALIAPFAYLGSDWDDRLEEAFSGGASEELLVSRGLGALFGTSAFRGAPLRNLVTRFVSDEMLAAIARERATGRVLLVATTNLDRQETVFWDMGAIAQHGGPEARDLFTDVLVASASVPGVFPPVMINVHDGGDAFQEMHVDGGASTPFFLAPDVSIVLNLTPEALRGANLYVISNNQPDGPSRTTPMSALAVADRSFESVMAHMTRMALAQTNDLAQRNAMSFHFTAIPAGYPWRGSRSFERQEMSALFAYGRRCALAGRVWISAQDVLAREGTTAPSASDCARLERRPDG